MYILKAGEGCVLKMRLVEANGAPIELRNARFVQAILHLPNEATMLCEYVRFDEVSQLVFVRLSAKDELTMEGVYGININALFDGRVVTSAVLDFAEVKANTESRYFELLIDLLVSTTDVPSCVKYTGASPKISENGTWLVFNDEIGAFEDTGIAAIGGGVSADAFAELLQSVAQKVDKVEGKGLSTNDYTDEDKALVQTIPNLATKNEVNTVQESTIEAIEGVRTELEAKANKDGYYPSMSVGMADNLVGRGDVQDAQINFRPSAGADNISDAAARIERIKGNSVVWNQRVNTNSTSLTLTASHIYIINVGGEISRLQPTENTTISVDASSDKVTDLTQMFSAGNEPTTVEEYYQRKPMNIEDEFTYNEGELIDMKVDSLISTSDNAYDYVKGYARVMGGHTYDCSYGTAFVEKVYFSTDKDNIVAEENAMTSENGKYTFPSDGYAVPYTTDGDVREYCVCLQHTYTKPHPAHRQVVKDLSFIGEAFPEGMRSVPQLYRTTEINPFTVKNVVCDEIQYNKSKNRWEKITKIKAVDLGNLEWYEFTYNETTVFRTSDVVDSKRPENYLNLTGSIIPIYEHRVSLRDIITYDKSYTLNSIAHGLNLFGIYDSQYNSVNDFKQAMQGVMLYYELAEPIVEEIEGSENWNLDYLAWDFGTEEAIASVPSAPFRADINYEPNAVDDLRWAVSEIRSLRAELAQLQSAQTSETNLTE